MNKRTLTSNKPTKNAKKKGYSYYVSQSDENRRKVWCTRVFTSINNAINSFSQLFSSGTFGILDVAFIFDVETDVEVHRCFYIGEPAQFVSLDIESGRKIQ